LPIKRHWQHWAHKTRNEDKQKQKTQQTQKIKKIDNTDPIKKSGVNSGARVSSSKFDFLITKEL